MNLFLVFKFTCCRKVRAFELRFCERWSAIWTKIGPTGTKSSWNPPILRNGQNNTSSFQTQTLFSTQPAPHGEAPPPINTTSILQVSSENYRGLNPLDHSATFQQLNSLVCFVWTRTLTFKNSDGRTKTTVPVVQLLRVETRSGGGMKTRARVVGITHMPRLPLHTRPHAFKTQTIAIQDAPQDKARGVALSCVPM